MEDPFYDEMTRGLTQLFIKEQRPHFVWELVNSAFYDYMRWWYEKHSIAGAKTNADGVLMLGRNDVFFNKVRNGKKDGERIIDVDSAVYLGPDDRKAPHKPSEPWALEQHWKQYKHKLLFSWMDMHKAYGSADTIESWWANVAENLQEKGRGYFLILNSRALFKWKEHCGGGTLAGNAHFLLEFDPSNTYTTPWGQKVTVSIRGFLNHVTYNMVRVDTRILNRYGLKAVERYRCTDVKWDQRHVQFGSFVLNQMEWEAIGLFDVLVVERNFGEAKETMEVEKVQPVDNLLDYAKQQVWKVFKLSKSKGFSVSNFPKIDNTVLSSITDPQIAKYRNDLLRDIFFNNKNITVVDLFSVAGWDGMSFLADFAVEKYFTCTTDYKFTYPNLSSFCTLKDKQFEDICVVQSTVAELMTTVISTQKIDLLYMDPPWTQESVLLDPPATVRFIKANISGLLAPRRPEVICLKTRFTMDQLSPYWTDPLNDWKWRMSIENQPSKTVYYFHIFAYVSYAGYKIPSPFVKYDFRRPPLAASAAPGFADGGGGRGERSANSRPRLKEPLLLHWDP